MATFKTLVTKSSISAVTTRTTIPIVCGFIPAKELVDRADIPLRDSEAGVGYQRRWSDERVSQLVDDLAAGTISLPTSVLLNVREFNGSQLIERVDKTWLRLRDEKLLVVDGQHRVRALRELVAADEEKWGTYRLPFVAMLGAEESEEIWQFYLVNSKARSVKVDLAYDILKQRAVTEAGFRETLKDTDRWKVDGQMLAEKLARQPVWRGRIEFPGPEKKQGATIRSGSFVSSLRPVLRDPVFSKLPHDDQGRALGAYWRAIQDVLPEVFETPDDYLLQKTVGVNALHAVFLDVYGIVQARRASAEHVAPYEAVLTPALKCLRGETPEGMVVEGADFWRKGHKGAAGSHSSGSGHRALATKLRAALPNVALERGSPAGGSGAQDALGDQHHSN